MLAHNNKSLPVTQYVAITCIGMIPTRNVCNMAYVLYLGLIRVHGIGLVQTGTQSGRTRIRKNARCKSVRKQDLHNMWQRTETYTVTALFLTTNM